MDSKEILEVHSMLHLIFHRNKNQHRRTKWWKWLSILKRATLDSARSGVTTHLATHVIPRCYIAFSTVVTDNQFSTLGIVLLAALARLSKVTGISHQLKMQPVTRSKIAPVKKDREDLGERIRRIDNTPVTPVKISQSDFKVPKASKVSEKPTERPTDDAVSKSTSKKKKKKNAIDDLFSGLF
ncbi:hypothetical protein DTO013E5_7586 [Penicillium roqueforti]|uniref:RNase MRP protein 1 RNA binding domain-containing protein n=1 Tax=Penicillium roqueforti (strain FM164) TaxID=1365484 RepID=W6QNT9_PENRF|nr:uncharacterized protein LCP9604111_8999 [Penicillium roqueforti]CDM37641.1 unnamed protein product [Penicillium roqueforti FM164]KAF9239722.1 hypothetical protein LCP9604111_8999 [Penicillium roqueforti]KAI1829803.1 hypothetical protein CBS147337_9435 [Penicillium roqueforti]KAI2670195.1 hypothetical protein CBS147355_9389 [Penicillium roqueforti]KAI2672495.1 hypothetical protein LCP963914a_9336 [Penicillium roqueforti]